MKMEKFINFIFLLTSAGNNLNGIIQFLVKVEKIVARHWTGV